jgi:hypothetical protein
MNTNGNGHEQIDCSNSATRLAARLQELRQELTKGEAQLENLERQRGHTRDALLRIGGAIQVLEELLQAELVQSQSNAAGQPA